MKSFLSWLTEVTRKSTMKYHVVHLASGTKAIENVSRSDATKFAREMSGDKKGSFMAQAAIDHEKSTKKD